MQEIQRIMERATLDDLPGTSAILGGLMVLGGCLVSYLMFRSVNNPSFTPIDFASLLDLSLYGQITFCVMWFMIGVGGVIAEIHFAQLLAKQQGISPKGRSQSQKRGGDPSFTARECIRPVCFRSGAPRTPEGLYCGRRSL
jgi:hypothetical protein